MSSVDQTGANLRHHFTVDVEEYFQVNAFESRVSRADWMQLPRRLQQNIPPLLDLLAQHNVTGTFFTLGWVADNEPDVVRRIADAGHEIASHGYWHRRVPALSPTAFRDDVRASKVALENLIGRRVVGYRAPSFSIGPNTKWAFAVLAEEGFEYDSSVFPIRRPGYGYPGTPRDPYTIRTGSGDLAEFPLATLAVAGLTLPAAGGAYLRQLPLALIRRAFSQAAGRTCPATLYIHPWEVDPGQPRLPVGIVTRIRHYRGLEWTLARLETLLRSFRFGSIESTRSSYPFWSGALVTMSDR